MPGIRVTVRRLTSDGHGRPRWSAELKDGEHEVVVNASGGLFCRTCHLGTCAGVKACAPHALRIKTGEDT